MARGTQAFKQAVEKRQAEGLTLPYLARYADIIALVEYLKKKPLGATHQEIKNVLGPEALDWRKVEAYRLVGFFNLDGKVTLIQKGVEFSQGDNETRKSLILDILKSVHPYNGILEWAHFQNRESLDAEGVRLKWSTEFPEIDKSSAQRFEMAPIFFFSLCDGAGLGKFLIGRKGQPTRLEIDRKELEAYVSHVSPMLALSTIDRLSPDHTEELREAPAQPVLPTQEKKLAKKIFVSHGRTKGPLAEVEEMLSMMGLEPKVAIREPHLARPVSEVVRNTMKDCSAAVFIFTPDETLTDEQGNKVYKPSENVLHELGGASVLYDDRIVILKEKSIRLPSNISGLTHIPFDVDNVKATFMDLYKELKAFGLV